MVSTAKAAAGDRGPNAANREATAVIDDNTNRILQDIVQREGRSLSQYVRDAFPWTTSEEHSALVQVRQLVDEEGRAAAELARFLQRQRRTMPPLGSYPMNFTDINYISLEHLL